MKLSYFLISVLTAFTLQPLSAQQKKNRQSGALKPRVIVLTDVSTWETDDSESLVRLLAHADMLEIEGLVFTTGWNLDKTRDDFLGLIHDAVDAYEKDLPNLRKRSGQKRHKGNEKRQQIGYWPDAEYLRSRTVTGSENRGFDFIGEDNDSEGSELIINMADEKDKRPVWVLAWGGGNTLAQALWRVQKNRSEDQLQEFLEKIRFYAITDQDRGQRTSFDISSHQWMRQEFGKELFFIWDESAWRYQNSTGRNNWDQYEAHIQEHGNLGDVYPKYEYGVEGDTPSFLYLLPNGLNAPENPNYGGWGGYFDWILSDDKKTHAYTNRSESKAHLTSGKYQEYFYPATFNNFAARMDWAAEGKGNRNPVIAVNGDRSLDILYLKPKQGQTMALDASKSFDPDGDQLRYKWWVLQEAGTYSDQVIVSENNTSRAQIHIPENSAGKTIHLICEVTDNGTHHLTSYRRIIFKPVK